MEYGYSLSLSGLVIIMLYSQQVCQLTFIIPCGKDHVICCIFADMFVPLFVIFILHFPSSEAENCYDISPKV